MKICVTAKGDSLDSLAEMRFGRSPFFIVIDEESGASSAIKNEYADAAGGVGPRSAQVLISNGVKVLITGQLGGNAQRAIEAAGIEVYQYRSDGTVNDALKQYRNGSLTRIL